jgi:MFS family permease
MNEPSPLPPAVEFKDRRGGMIGFGIVMIIAGCVCALFVPLMLLGQALAARTAGTAPAYFTILPAVVLYAVLAVAFVWLGIGSILVRRWARALSLIVGWLWLVSGAMGTVMAAFVLPKAFGAQQPSGAQLPDSFRVMVMVLTFGMLAVIMVVLPALLVLFYGNRHVKATCEARDPVRRWTDACPLPVLALSLVLGVGVLSMFPMLLGFHAVVPFFGTLASGTAGTALLLAMMAVWGYCAWATYRLKPAVWWLLVAGFGLLMISSVLTFSRVDPIEMYRLMGYPEAQLAQIEKATVLGRRTMLLFMLVGTVPFLGYLLYLRKFFRQSSSQK